MNLSLSRRTLVSSTNVQTDCREHKIISLNIKHNNTKFILSYIFVFTFVHKYLLFSSFSSPLAETITISRK
jgi:hypothetical protein